MNIEQVLRQWAGSIAFFPQSPEAQAEIGAIVRRWLDADPQKAARQLSWLHTNTLIEMPRWEGMQKLRTLFLSRYRLPAGIEQYNPERGTYYLDGERYGERDLLPAGKLLDTKGLK